MSQNSYLREFCAQVSQIVFLADLTFLRLITTVWKKLSPNSYLPEFCAQVSQIVLLADLTVLRLNTTVWAKMSRNSYLHEICAQVTQIVFLADLTILRLLTTVSEKLSENSYLREFWFDRFMAKYNCMRENVAKFISPRVVCTNITNRVLSWFDRFTAYYYCMNKKFKKTHISTSFVHNQRFRASYQTLNKNVRKLISPRVLCTSVTNRVFSWFDRFTAYLELYEA